MARNSVTQDLHTLALRIMIGARSESACHPTSRAYLQRALPHFTKEQSTSFIISNLVQFGRDYNNMLLVCAPELWMDFDVDDWTNLIGLATPRPRRDQFYDTGMFSDVSFLLRWIRIDALKLIGAADAVAACDKLAIAEYCWRYAPFALSSSESALLGWDDVSNFLEILAGARARLLSHCPILGECPASSDELRAKAHEYFIAWGGSDDMEYRPE